MNKNLKVKTKHKDKKKCMVLMSVLQKQHNMPKGTLLQVKKPFHCEIIEKNPNKEHILPSERIASLAIKKSKTVQEGECLVYLDVVWDPDRQLHYIRFLSNGKIVGIRHVKKVTIKYMKTALEIVKKGTHDIDEEKIKK